MAPSSDTTIARAGSSRLTLAAALLAAVPALVLRLFGADIAHTLEALLFGVAIVGAAFLLSWAAEVARLDIPAGLALAVLALIAVLPEYAVDFVFAWQGGASVRQYGPACPSGEPGAASPCSLALANMTGANRLLIGIGWASVVFIAWYRTRRLRRRAEAEAAADGTEVPARSLRWSDVRLERSHAVEVAFLAVGDRLLAHAAAEALDHADRQRRPDRPVRRVRRPPLEGAGRGAAPGRSGQLDRVVLRDAAARRTVVALFAWSAVVIVLCAEPFAHALVETGHQYGISEFFLVQWLAPLASEAPEFIIAALFAWRLETSSGLGALVSSKVNQWTLLVGSLPIVFAISSHSLHGLPIAGIQREELLLTAAQSLFAVAVIVNLRMSIGEALVISGLFWAQFVASLIAGVQHSRRGPAGHLRRVPVARRRPADPQPRPGRRAAPRRVPHALRSADGLRRLVASPRSSAHAITGGRRT